MEDEYLDLVDAEDRVIGRKLRSEIKAEGLRNYRVVNTLLVNSKGELWIPRRTAEKGQFPLALDFSMAGHVTSGETYEATFERELREELNLEAEKVQSRLLGHLQPGSDGVAAFMNVYEIRSNDVPPYNPADFTEYFWLTPEALLARIRSGDISKDDLPRVVGIFYKTL